MNAPISPKARYSFDPACLTLAEHFLPSTASDGLKWELAQAIQNAVESFCEDEFKTVSLPRNQTHEH